MDTKIEYQLTPEQAEQLAIETAGIKLPLLREQSSWALPALFTAFFGFVGVKAIVPIVLGAYSVILAIPMRIDTTGASNSSDQNLPTETLLYAGTVLICCGAGFAFAKVLQFRIRKNIRRQSRKNLDAIGAERSLAWNEDSFTVVSPMWQSTVRWALIKGFVIEKAGIPVLSSSRTAFVSIPKSALPTGLSAEALVENWRRFTPPVQPTK